ncbi:unnamed protein product [Cuscuta epithymum]|uniref:PUM-HD domain-containing protein n=1 Tax=Cuscuta epithymum TaxID=186058 RepID=A0AAV0CSS1_9ASTE|nr:unnamed protein product [Cuscuta epithymum]CAH9125650.1 unnamed protein product [Cuscuta epithymum]
MFERVKMKDDEELEMLLDEIPHVTCFDHPNSINGVCYEYDHGSGSDVQQKLIENCLYEHHSWVSLVSGFSLKSDGSSSSLLSGGSPTLSSFEDVIKSQYHYRNTSDNINKLRIDPDYYHHDDGNNTSNFCELNLSRSLSTMQLNEVEQESVASSSPTATFWSHNYSNRKNVRMISNKYFASDHHSMHESFYGITRHDNLGVLGHLTSPMAYNNGGPGNKMDIKYHIHHIGIPLVDLPNDVTSSNGISDLPRYGAYAIENSSNNLPKVPHLNSCMGSENGRRYKAHSSCVKIPIMRKLEVFDWEANLIDETGKGHHRFLRPQEKRFSPVKGFRECGGTERMCSFPSSLPLKLSSFREAKGYIYHIAKDQQGCRFLQRMFDVGSPQDVLVICNAIIDHVVELMMNPFGNYLIQKLLEVCNEEQRMEILHRVTEEPSQIVGISLNTHGTRVVQKLIETLKTREQISLIISSLEPGFLSLIKDLNGNHVIQRCLQYLPNEDTKFIFVAAAKHCVDIATHQHGCYVLQRCITHGIGNHRERLIAEISSNGFLLAHDAFGNYVVQFILELKIPSAISKLISHFEGNFVHLSTQKFSSHVVEKCLVECDYKVKSKIVHELISTTHFERLLQDPHANYVIQTALRTSEGCLHSLLIEAIESHKAITGNNPYSKRIFSNKLWKR